jgi:hypothetical protein
MAEFVVPKHWIKLKWIEYKISVLCPRCKVFTKYVGSDLLVPEETEDLSAGKFICKNCGIEMDQFNVGGAEDDFIREKKTVVRDVYSTENGIVRVLDFGDFGKKN